MELADSEITELLEPKLNATSSTGHTLPPGIFEIGDLNLILNSLLRDDKEIIFTTDVFRLRSI